jgi:hypothetical protein
MHTPSIMTDSWEMAGGPLDQAFVELRIVAWQHLDPIAREVKVDGAVIVVPVDVVARRALSRQPDALDLL